MEKELFRLVVCLALIYVGLTVSMYMCMYVVTVHLSKQHAPVGMQYNVIFIRVVVHMH